MGGGGGSELGMGGRGGGGGSELGKGWKEGGQS